MEDATWRGGAALPAGGAFLAREAAGDRLSVLTLAGPLAGRRARASLAARLLLGRPEAADAPPLEAEGEAAAVVVLATARCAEDDATLVVLDAAADAQLPAGTDALAAAALALSSLVLHADTAAPSTFSRPFPACWPPFRALAGELAREFAAADVLELLPRALALDEASSPSSWPSPSPSPSPSLLSESRADDLLALRAATTAAAAGASSGAVSPRELLHTGLWAFARPLAPVKTLFGAELTGEALLSLLRSLAVADGAQGPLDLAAAWDELVERGCRAAAADALATYVDCVPPAAREAPPMELEAFVKLHADFSRLSLDVFHSAAAAFPRANARRRAERRRLKDAVAARFEQELEALRDNSRGFCEALKAELWAELSAQAADDQARQEEGDDQARADALLQAVREFDAQYAARARGPAKDAVLREFYRREAVGAFERLRRAGVARASEARVQELRARLEREAEARKQALAARFEAREAQLRAGVARELEGARKLQAARLSRAKLDEREAARARDALAALERRNSELEAGAAALEQALEAAQLQRARLERQVGELEAAARREMASRAEMVDTLAATIRAAEEKERALRSRVAALEQELGEKTFRVEGELRGVARQLLKATEERDELRNKLGELFLRLTALPPAVQQHVLSAAGDEQVQFADALASFMSD